MTGEKQSSTYRARVIREEDLVCQFLLAKEKAGMLTAEEIVYISQRPRNELFRSAGVYTVEASEESYFAVRNHVTAVRKRRLLEKHPEWRDELNLALERGQSL